MSAQSTGEKIWQNQLDGCQQALEEAKEMLQNGDKLGAYVKAASAHYSFATGQTGFLRRLATVRSFVRAKHWARKAARLVQPEQQVQLERYDVLTHEQCDVIGTILLRRSLWMEGDPFEAFLFLDAGLKKENVPPHSRALLHMGVAEATLAVSAANTFKSKEHMHAALALESEIMSGADVVMAGRQFTRVLKRAFVLEWHLGDKAAAKAHYIRALQYARNPKWGSTGQLAKIEEAWSRLHSPSWWHWLLPQ